MMISRLASPPLFALLALAGTALAADQPPYPATGVERPSIRVQVTPRDKVAFREILRSDMDITEVHGNHVDLLVTPSQLGEIEARGNAARIVTADVYAGPPLRGGSWLPEYMSYTEAVAALNSLASTYPSLTALDSIGTSIQGRTIWALKISDNPLVDENEPEVLVMGNHHAREVISVIIPMALADSMLTNYGMNATFTQWVDERETFIVPVVNPDGLVYVETTNLFWRKNRRANAGGSFGVDPNRNYAYEWGHDNNGSSASGSSEVYRGTAPASEPEVAAIQTFVDSREFVFSISYHSYSNLVLWGPGYKPALPEDQDIFAGFGELATQSNLYLPGNPASGAIYITNGDADDWLYHAASHEKIFAFTPEVGSSSDYFNPPASRIPTLVIEGLDPSFVALEHADRPGRLAPPGPPVMDPVPASSDGSFDVTWSAPVVADTEVVSYELTEKIGPAVITDDVDSPALPFDLGGWSESTARAYSGSKSLYSGAGNDLNRICLAHDPYVVQPGDSFSFRAWYDIELDWDYAYAIVSTDGGRTFTNLAGTATTMSDPNGNNADNGITGTSSAWSLHSYSLAAYVGLPVWLGFRYYTDGGVAPEGIYVDNVWPVQTWTTTWVVSTGIGGTTYSISGRGDGTYYYSVRGQDAEGDWGYRSADEPVTVNLSTGAPLASQSGFFLGKPVPNPSGGSMTIRFGLAGSSEHTLVVHDVAGRRVRLLSSGIARAGVHTVRWDGRDDGGDPVASGIYVYRLSSPAGDRVERATVLR
jgi:hypothetical protein